GTLKSDHALLDITTSTPPGAIERIDEGLSCSGPFGTTTRRTPSGTTLPVASASSCHRCAHDVHVLVRNASNVSWPTAAIGSTTPSPVGDTPATWSATLPRSTLASTRCAWEGTPIGALAEGRFPCRCSTLAASP